MGWREHRYLGVLPDAVASIAVEHRAEGLDETDRLLEALEPVITKYRDSKKRRESLAMHRALCLAPSLDVFEALCRGEKVPRSRLDQKWLRAFNL